MILEVNLSRIGKCEPFLHRICAVCGIGETIK